jgi:hypothetical protein
VDIEPVEEEATVKQHDSDVTDPISAAFRIDDAARAVQAIHGVRGRRRTVRDTAVRPGARPTAGTSPHSGSSS